MNSQAFRFGLALVFGTLVGPRFCEAAVVTVFSDDFEAGLSQWVGQGGGTHHGVVVADPLRGGNQVLSFNGTNAGGDMFGASLLTLTPGETYRLSFEYLGVAEAGSVPGDLGGFVGFSEAFPGAHSWLFGTSSDSGAAPDLVDDGQWHSYVYEFVPPFSWESVVSSSSSLRVMLEDYTYSGGVAGDIYFDNLVLSQVPEPASFPVVAGLAALTFGAWRRWRS